MIEAGTGSFLWKLPTACGPDSPFAAWPDLVMQNMAEVQQMRGEDEIYVKAKGMTSPRTRIYDSVQITSQPCICRVGFGGDRHQSAQSSSDSTVSGGKIYEIWRNVLRNSRDAGTFSTKASHFVLNRYVHSMKHGIDAHADKSQTYNEKNPILSVSFLTGSILVITVQGNSRKSAAFFQNPGDIFIMAGQFQKRFFMQFLT